MLLVPFCAIATACFVFFVLLNALVYGVCRGLWILTNPVFLVVVVLGWFAFVAVLWGRAAVRCGSCSMTAR